MWLLPVLDRVSSFAARAYYRLSIEGARVPETGPVLLVANHPNSLFDPALVAAAARRPVRFLAKEPLLHHPGIGWLIRGSGAIPIYRMSDDPARVHRNDESFRAAHEALVQGAAIGMFPEGISHDLPALAPVKSGAARIALGAARRLGRSFPIVPVGLTFRGKERFRSEALALVGEAVPWDDLVGPDEPAGASVRELTRRIGEALLNQTLNLETWEDAPLIEWAAAIYAAEVAPVDRPASRIHIEREASAVLRRLRGEEWPGLRELFDQVDSHARSLRSFGLRPLDLRRLPRLREAAGWSARQGLALLSMGALGVLGHIFFFVPVRLTGYAAGRLKPTPDVRSTYLTLGGALFGLIWILLLAAIASILAGPLAALGALTLLPLLAVAAVAFRDRWNDARSIARRFLFLRSRRKLHVELAQRQSELAHRLEEVRVPVAGRGETEVAVPAATPKPPPVRP